MFYVLQIFTLHFIDNFCLSQLKKEQQSFFSLVGVSQDYSCPRGKYTVNLWIIDH